MRVFGRVSADEGLRALLAGSNEDGAVERENEDLPVAGVSSVS